MRMSSVAASLLLAAAGQCALAQSYTVTILRPPAGAAFAGSIGYGSAIGSQVGAIRNSTSEGHAALWRGSPESFVDLQPLGAQYFRSAALACDGATQVGYASVTPPGATITHAFLWRGTAASGLDLHPVGNLAGYDGSRLTGVSNGRQSGTLVSSNGLRDHAGVWSGTAGSFIDLQPLSGFLSSTALAIRGNTQAGWGLTDAFITHALAWQGTAASAVDLHTSTYSYTQAFATDGPRQGGEGAGFFGPEGERFEVHALLWSGTAGSVVDLHPSGYDSSTVRGMGGEDAGGLQVGYAAGPATNFDNHAVTWSGSASSMIDLHAFLPGNFIDSQALAVAPDGTIVGEGGAGREGIFAIIWTPQPVPCTADFNHDGDIGTDADIEAFFACLAGNCCANCATSDFNHDGDVGTDQDIEAFFRVLAGGNC